MNSIITGDTALKAWPFMLCMEEAEGSPSAGQGCWTKTMGSSNISWSTISTCSTQEFNAVQTAGMQATPKHDYVPWVLVNGNLVDNPDYSLLYTICKAYTGPPPASCKKYENEVSINN